MARVIKLQDIRLDGGTQFREEIDQNKVKEYAENMDDGDVFPPLQCTFDGSTYWLWDGFHRYFAWQSLGAKTVEVVYTPGTQEDAQDLALGANGTHGLPPTKATKENKVRAALSMERHAGLSNRQFAKLCKVSHTFVASVRDASVKATQAANRVASAAKQAVESDSTPAQKPVVDAPKVESDSTPVAQDYGPSEDELKANELAQQADMDMLNKLLESDDALKLAVEENKRLNLLVAQKEVRIAALMNEKNAAVKHAQALEKQLKKATKK